MCVDSFIVIDIYLFRFDPPQKISLTHASTTNRLSADFVYKNVELCILSRVSLRCHNYDIAKRPYSK